jgi:hypothetical protein
LIETVAIDTHGGLSPERAGGGHQSILRPLTRTVKNMYKRFGTLLLSKDQYVEHEFKNTYAENSYMI